MTFLHIVQATMPLLVTFVWLWTIRFVVNSRLRRITLCPICSGIVWEVNYLTHVMWHRQLADVSDLPTRPPDAGPVITMAPHPARSSGSSDLDQRGLPAGRATFARDRRR